MKPSASHGMRLRVFLGLLCGLRKYDLRAAATWINTMYPGVSLVGRLVKFLRWSLWQMWCEIPDALCTATFAPDVSRTPIWLAAGNPLENHPWGSDANARLPERVHVIVMGAGFTGGALAYHWSRRAAAAPDLTMAVLDMGEAASGSSGRNEGLVVMGRYCHMVQQTVVKHLPAVRPDLSEPDRRQIARQFAVSGTGVSFNAARCLVNRILELIDEPDDYPPEYFAPTRLLDPKHHTWPKLERSPGG